MATVIPDSEITAEMILGHPEGSVLLPNNVPVPAECRVQAESYAAYQAKKRAGKAGKLDSVPIKGGYGSWSPMKASCVMCSGSLQCFARTKNTPYEIVLAALERAAALQNKPKAKRQPKKSKKTENQENNE